MENSLIVSISLFSIRLKQLLQFEQKQEKIQADMRRNAEQEALEEEKKKARKKKQKQRKMKKKTKRNKRKKQRNKKREVGHKEQQ